MNARTALLVVVVAVVATLVASVLIPGATAPGWSDAPGAHHGPVADAGHAPHAGPHGGWGSMGYAGGLLSWWGLAWVFVLVAALGAALAFRSTRGGDAGPN